MARVATKTQGLRFYIGTTADDGTTDTYTQIKRCKAFDAFGLESPVIDVTAYEDTVKQKLKGVADAGDLAIGGNRVFTDAGQNALKAASEDAGDTPYNFRVEKDGAGASAANLRWSFKAMVTMFRDKPGAVDNGVMEYEGKLAVTSAVTQSTVS